MEKKESFFDYCKNYISEHLGNFKGQTTTSCDLYSKITEEPNINGSLTFSSYEAKQYLREWWDEVGEYLEYEIINFGEHFHNPFNEPEVYMVCMVIEGINIMISRCDIINKNWNDEIELNEKNIKTILEQVEKQTNENLF